MPPTRRPAVTPPLRSPAARTPGVVSRRHVGLMLVGALVVTGCATGDGRTLRTPDVPPPAATAPPHVDGPVEFPTDLDGAGTIPAELLDDDGLLPEPAEFELFAPWRDGAPLGVRHTCDGEDVSPALTWTGVPDGTIELALVVDDVQTAGSIHWLVTGIDPASVSMFDGSVPPGASELTNSFGVAGWTGPCPPQDSTRTYRFSLFAIDQQLEGLDGQAPVMAASLIEGLALDVTRVTGTYAGQP